MLEICKVYPMIIDNSVPDKINCEHDHSVECIEYNIKEEMGEPENFRRHSSHELKMFALRLIIFG